jgi:hypothetical protein
MPLTINRPSCTQAFTVRTLNICRKPRHQQKNQPVPPPSSSHHHWPNQICNATMFLVYLMFKQGPKQGSNWEKARKMTCGLDRSPLSWHTMDTDTNAVMLHWEDMPPSLQKDTWAITAHWGSFIAAAAAASPTGTNLFPLVGDISNI